MGIKKKHTPGCSCCGGAGCCSGGNPSSFDVVISGINSEVVNAGPGGCLFECDQFNGTWSVPYDASVSGPGDCPGYLYEATMICGGVSRTASILINCYSTKDVSIQLLINAFDGNNKVMHAAFKAYTPTDCLDMVDESLDLVADVYLTPYCSGANGTALLTAVA